MDSHVDRLKNKIRNILAEKLVYLSSGILINFIFIEMFTTFTVYYNSFSYLISVVFYLDNFFWFLMSCIWIQHQLSDSLCSIIMSR